MSSTARGGVREVSDYYATPRGAIVTFLDSFLCTPEGNSLMQPYPQEKLLRTDLKILDPCAGGNLEPKAYEGKSKGKSVMYDTKMAYPTVLADYGAIHIVTNDIREDSPATYHKDFVSVPSHENIYDLVISNPPFAFAEQFIVNSLKLVKEGGWLLCSCVSIFLEVKNEKSFGKRICQNIPLFIERECDLLPTVGLTQSSINIVSGLKGKTQSGQNGR